MVLSVSRLRAWWHGDPLGRAQPWTLVAFGAVLPLGQSPAEIAWGLGLAAWIARGVCGQRRPFLRAVPLSPWLVAWGLWAVWSTAHSVAVGASLQGLRKLVKGFALYCLVAETIDDDRWLSRVVAGCLVGVGFISLDGLWQAVWGRDLLGQPLSTTLDGAVTRVQATFNHPANLGIYLASFAPLALGWVLGARRRRWLAWGVFALSAATIVLARSRGGFLAYLAGLAVLALLVRRWWPLGFAGLLAALQAATVPPAVKAWAATMPSLLHQLTEPERLMYWQAAWHMIRTHPVLGVGPNTFILAYPAYRSAGDRFAQVGPYAHNQYLHLAAELGVVGLAIFLGLLAASLLAALRALRAPMAEPGRRALLASLCAGLAGYMVAGLFESSLFYARGLLMFWFLIGLLTAASATRAGAQGRAGWPAGKPPALP